MMSYMRSSTGTVWARWLRTNAFMKTECGGSVKVVGVALFGMTLSRATPRDLHDLRTSAVAAARDMPGSRRATTGGGKPGEPAAPVVAVLTMVEDWRT